MFDPARGSLPDACDKLSAPAMDVVSNADCRLSHAAYDTPRHGMQQLYGVMVLRQ